MLHPAPSSGLYFTTAMPLLNRQRRVIAPDYPGYGGSDPIDDPSIGSYAAAVAECIDVLGLADFDLFGFHTGCLVAVELALAGSVPIGKLVLCDVPYFTPAEQDALRDRAARPLPLGPGLDSLAEAWDFDVARRLDAVPLDRCLALFAEHLRAGTNDWLGFAAAFDYDCETRFAGLDRPVVVIATDSGLCDATRAAAAALPDARLVEAAEITTAVFEAGAEAIAKRVGAALDE